MAFLIPNYDLIGLSNSTMKFDLFTLLKKETVKVFQWSWLVKKEYPIPTNVDAWVYDLSLYLIECLYFHYKKTKCLISSMKDI